MKRCDQCHYWKLLGNGSQGMCLIAAAEHNMMYVRKAGDKGCSDRFVPIGSDEELSPMYGPFAAEYADYSSYLQDVILEYAVSVC